MQKSRGTQCPWRNLIELILFQLTTNHMPVLKCAKLSRNKRSQLLLCGIPLETSHIPTHLSQIVTVSIKFKVSVYTV